MLRTCRSLHRQLVVGAPGWGAVPLLEDTVPNASARQLHFRSSNLRAGHLSVPRRSICHATNLRSREQQQQYRRHDRPRPARTKQSALTRPQHSHHYMVTCHPGLEEIAAQELQQEHINAKQVSVVGPGRVSFSDDGMEAGYRAVLWLRTATRVLHQLSTQPLNPRGAAGDTVYDFTRDAADWSNMLAAGQTFDVTSQVWGCSNVSNSQLVSRRVRDAVCDSVRDVSGVRPPPPGSTAPHILLYISLLQDTAVLYRDLGGGSLHRRGYRGGGPIHKASLNEAAAAGLLLLAGWREAAAAGGAVLADPMCGSGSLLIEAALIASNTAPGLLRDTSLRPWPFVFWHDAQQQLWEDLLVEARGVSALPGQLPGEMRATGSRRRRGTDVLGGGAAAAAGNAGKSSSSSSGSGCSFKILGGDIHPGAIRLARTSAAAAGVSHLLQLQCGPAGQWTPAATPTFVVANPPWGLRLQGSGDTGFTRGSWAPSPARGRASGRSGAWQEDDEEVADGEALADTWQQLSHFLKTQCPGADAWVLSGNPEATGHLRMRSCRKRSISIGGTKTAWLKYEVRSGETRPTGGDRSRQAASTRAGAEGRPSWL